MAKISDTQNWREELEQLGKEYFIIQEMLRTGFLKISPDELMEMKLKLRELQKINTELTKISQEVKGLEDITPIIKQIRQNRIERVRAEKAIKKAEKAQAEAIRKAQISKKRKNQPPFLGKMVAQGLKFTDHQDELLTAQGLPLVHDLHELSVAMSLTCEEIQWLCYHRQSATIDHYSRFQIPKRKGGMRSISAPKPKMRIAQQWILDNILSKIPIHPASMAFQTAKSIADNASSHLHKNILIRLDLKDFFPSIHFGRVKGIFKSLGYSYGMASVFALICTDAMRIGAKLGDKKYFVALGNRYVPQGACTSPTLTNIICRTLDNRLYKWAEKNGWTYTRYADDLVFSHPNPSTDIKGVLGIIKKIIAEENFELNPEKTLVMRPHQRQAVTGIVVNGEKMRISRRDIRKFRAFLHQYALKGHEKMSEELGKDATLYGKGYLAFVQMVNPQQAEKFKLQYAWLGE